MMCTYTSSKHMHMKCCDLAKCKVNCSSKNNKMNYGPIKIFFQ